MSSFLQKIPQPLISPHIKLSTKLFGAEIGDGTLTYKIIEKFDGPAYMIFPFYISHYAEWESKIKLWHTNRFIAGQ